MKFFFALFLLGLVGMAMADVKTATAPVIVGAAPVQTTPLVVTDVTKTITVQQAISPSPLQVQQAQVFTTTIPTMVPGLVPARTPVAFIGFASSASSLSPFFKFW